MCAHHERKNGVLFLLPNYTIIGTQLIVVPRRLSRAVWNLWKSWNGKNNMNIAPPGCAGLRRRRSRVIASSLCRGENWLILVDVRAFSRNSTVIYPCQIVFRLRASVSPISADVEGGLNEKKYVSDIPRRFTTTTPLTVCTYYIIIICEYTSGYITAACLCWILQTAHERCQIPLKLNQSRVKYSVPFSDAARLLCDRFPRSPTISALAYELCYILV